MLSIEKRTFLVKKYLETKSYKKTQEDFFAKFGKTSPCKTAIVKLVQILILKLIRKLFKSLYQCWKSQIDTAICNRMELHATLPGPLWIS